MTTMALLVLHTGELKSVYYFWKLFEIQTKIFEIQTKATVSQILSAGGFPVQNSTVKFQFS